MNETIPTPEPDNVPAQPSVPPGDQAPPSLPEMLAPVPQPKPKPPGMGVGIALGVLLCIVSAGLAFVIPPIVLLGLVAAIATLFFKGYRSIFLGYILTVGVVLLGTIIYCSNHPLDLK